MNLLAQYEILKLNIDEQKKCLVGWFEGFVYKISKKLHSDCNRFVFLIFSCEGAAQHLHLCLSLSVCLSVVKPECSQLMTTYDSL